MCPELESAGLPPGLLEDLVRIFRDVRADEGTLWLLNEAQDCLVPQWNSGPDAAQFVGHFQQPLERGLISLVCISEQGLCENQVYRNETQDPTLDRKLGKRTCSMIAAPVRNGGAIRGVVSCVKLKSGADASADPAGFSMQDLESVAGAAEVVGAAMTPRP